MSSMGVRPPKPHYTRPGCVWDNYGTRNSEGGLGYAQPGDLFGNNRLLMSAGSIPTRSSGQAIGQESRLVEEKGAMMNLLLVRAWF